MSQSPADISDSDAVFRYRKAWAAINALIVQGRTLSGRERNCAFLNTGGPQFADVSAASGLDFQDDSRAVAIVDWDFDGRQDLWTTNRSGPWLRLLRNQCQTDHHFLAVKLQGTQCNRDAIGARVEVVLKTDGGEQRAEGGGGHFASRISDPASPNIPATRLIKTLRAGEGFLSQSSKWIHFGLGQSIEIDRLVVHWPGGQQETFRGLMADGHYYVVQGTGKPRKWNPPQPSIVLADASVKRPSSSDRARIFMASRVPMPHVNFTDFNDQQLPLHEAGGQPRLVNLWASWCKPCLEELRNWTENESQMRQLGLDVVALTVDELGEDTKGSRDSAKKLLARLQFPFRSGIATDDVIAVMQVAVRALVDKPQPLLIPSSFLLDKQGRVAAIYQGQVGIEQLALDVDMLDGDDTQINSYAAHFPGRWIAGPHAPNPGAIVEKFVVAGRPKDAKSYLDRLTAGRHGKDKWMIQAYYAIADQLRTAGKLEAAVISYRRALQVNLRQPSVNLDLGIVLMNLGQLAEAVPHLQIAHEANPHDDEARKRLVVALVLGGRPSQALEHCQHLVVADPKDVFAQLFLAKASMSRNAGPAALNEYRKAFLLGLDQTSASPRSINRLRQLIEIDDRDPFARFYFAKALQYQGLAAEAVREYRLALKLRPDWLAAANDLAWLLATHPDEQVRDAREAVRLATAASEATHHREPAVLDTLAAAQAEAGQFDEAIRTIDNAVVLAEKGGQSVLVEQLRDRSQIYQAGKPYRDEGKRPLPTEQ